MHSFIIYLALGDIGADGSYVRPYSAHDKQLGGQFVDKVDGYTPELGKFVLRFANGKNVVARSFLAARVEPEPDLRKMKELLISGTKVFELKSEKSEQETVQHLGLMGYVPENAPPTDRPNILLVQVTFTDSTSLDVIFESGSVENRPDALTGGVFDKLLAERSKAFHDKFEKTFGLVAKGYPEFYQTMGQYALCNMVGSIGYFYGSNLVQGPYNSQPVPYGPHALFATVPSRPFFPRGFLWDEGFHHLLLRKFDSELSLEILGSWLDLMNVEGWIPREMILGAEAEHKVPAEFVVQRNSVANPPMFFYLLSRYLAEEKFADKHAAYLEKVYPRLKAWYGWLNRTQSGREPGTYRWRGRNATTDLELNPKTLPSGLDDYPRASHPTDDEYHLDLVCWMSVSSKVMAELAGRVKDADHAAFEATAKKLSDIEHLDAKHWSEKTGRYCDFGMHTRHVKLVKPAPVMGPDGRPRPPPRPDMTREVLRAPTARLVTDTFGYVSLFPLFLRLIPADSPKLGRILEQLTDADLLWTSFGLRSLARTSPLYSARNTEHDPPYWRGSVWMNMNFLALSSLKHYSTVTGPHQATAFKVYSELRGAVVANVAREFKRTGFLWEHYNDETGHGEGTHPFTGWTSLVLLMMSEQYD
uniref:mannosyl-oligosaccharide glucosidase n=1 Tax=Plectus sambesii TaxID=2011161 RepID=A0A914WQK2_9BILA